MKSIRLSLLAYFVVLLVLAVGAASLLAYRTGEQTLRAEQKTTEQTLRSKQETTQQLLNAQHKERCREEEKRLNDALLTQAQHLAGIVQFHFDSNRYRYRPLHLFGLAGLDMAPGGWCMAPLWIAQGTRSPVSSEMGRMRDYRWTNLAEISFNESDLLEHFDERVAEFFQINSDRGSTYLSPSLMDRPLPLDTAAFAPDQAVYHQFSDTVLDAALTVRRVILKTPVTRLVPSGPRPPRPISEPAGSDPPRPLRSDTPREPPRRSSIYIQCAVDLSRLNSALALFAQRHDRERADLQAETLASLSALDDQTLSSLTDLRTRLLLIGTLTLVAAGIGTFWIVRHGLAPLSRLSEAVSRISPRHLELPFGEQKLPAELRPIVERLKQTLEQLRRAFEREKQATADISHELRTPLAALLTTTEIALRKPRTAEQYRELLEDCRQSGQQMNQAVERLLTLARLDAGVDQLRPQTVDAAALAEQCAAVVRPLAEARNLRLTVHRNGAAPLTTDPDKLREVVTNLLHNAIQYNRPNGSIDLNVHMAGPWLQLEVHDTGIGISPEARDRIFERFYRADPSRGTDGLHAGLGLAIVKEYVNLLGGSITVESAVNEGTTFRVSLPVMAQAA